MAHLHDLVEESITLTSSTADVDYNDDDDHEDDDATPYLPVVELQEFVRTPSNKISIFGDDDKAKAWCGRDVVISVTFCQSVHTIVAEVQAPSSSDHDFNTENLIPPVTHRMNITSDSGDSIYSGGEEGGGCMYLSAHDATFEPSTGINHAGIF